MDKVKKAFLVSSLNQYIVFVISFVSVVTFARLLTPAELGVFALCSSLTVILTQLRFLGAGAYIIRQKDLTTENIKSGLGLTVVMSWVLGTLLIASSHFIEKFFDAEGLQLVIIIVSINFYFAPFLGVNASLLSKEMAFDKITILSLSNQFVIFFVSLILVLLGLSFYGMALGFLAGTIVQFLVMLKCQSNRMVFKPSFSGFAPIVKLGINTSGANFLKTFELSLPDLFIGKTFNISSVAIFSRALGFQQFFTNLLVVGVNPVILPFLSGIKNTGEDPTQAYIKATTLLLGIALPILLVASAAAYPAVLLMFGDQWTESVPLVSVLAFWAIFNIVNQFTPNLLIVNELDNWLLYLQVISSIIYGILLYISIPYGLLGVAIAMATGSFINLVVILSFLKIKVQIKLFILLKDNLSSLFVSGACYLSTLGLDRLINFKDSSPSFSIFIIAITLPIVWLISITISRHPILDIIIKPILAKSKII